MQHTVLVVEDETALRVIYEYVLLPMGFEVLHAADGAQALAILEQTTPDIVFLDMLLPQIDGRTVLNYLRTASHLTQTRVVIVTAHTRFESDAGDKDQFLLKPVLPAALREAARRALADREQ